MNGLSATTSLLPQKVPASASEIMSSPMSDMQAVDGTPSTFGRMKENKVCDAPSLRKDAKTAQEMAQFAFAPGIRVTLNFDQTPSSALISSSSSTSSVEHDREEQRQNNLRKKILKRTVSRQGRETQRWSTKDNCRVRLVTGCVPILKGGHILFVSSRSKPEWILPKGGWEEDETMEESAIRETFEEAGVVGTLGSKLSPIQYETRKSKKRRKEMEDIIKRSKEAAEVTLDEFKDHTTKKAKENPSVEADHGRLMLTSSPSTDGSLGTRGQNCFDLTSTQGVILSEAVVQGIPGTVMKRSDETASNASDSSTNYAYAKLTMFPLYVSEIRETWPESGRLRKVVHIDEAIELMKSREEFQAALIEVKERKLHLVSETPVVQEDRT